MLTLPVMAQRGPGGPNRDDTIIIHELIDLHKNVKRTVKNLPTGVETLTESNDPKTIKLIKQHVWAMKKRIESGRPIRMWDPLFAELFTQHKKISMKVEETEKGVKVVETSTDAYVIKLIQMHAEVVSSFAKEGMPAMHREHPVPKKP